MCFVVYVVLLTRVVFGGVVCVGILARWRSIS